LTPSTPPFDRRSRWIATLASGLIAALALGMLIARLTGVGAFAQGYEAPPPSPPRSDVLGAIFDASHKPVLVAGKAELPVAATTLLESKPAVAMDDAGNFVVAWASRSPEEGFSEVVASHVTALGGVSGRFQVASQAAGESDPSVAMAADGRFVISYTSAGDVRARLYATNRTTIRDIVVAANSPTESQSAVARNSSGKFAVAFRVASTEIHLRRFDAGGATIGQHIIARTPLGARNPSVAIDAAGNSAVAWQELKSAGDWDVKSRRVSSTGAVQGVATVRATTEVETKPAIAMPSSTTVAQAVAYQTGPESPTSATKVRVTELTSTGTIRANLDLGAGHNEPAISVDGLGRYHVAYSSLVGPNDPGDGVFGRVWPVGQTSTGAEFHANTTTAGSQSQAAVASNRTGRSVVVWTHDPSPASDLDARLELKFGGRDVAVTGPLVCGAGNQWLITVFVAQGRVRDDSRSRGMCTGDVQEWRARVAAARAGAFKPGGARSCAHLTATDARGRVTQTRRWCREVMLVSEIGAGAEDDDDDDDALIIVAFVYGTLALLFAVAMFLRSRRRT